MIDWRNLKIGDKLVYSFADFDGNGHYTVTVDKIESDHAIAISDNDSDIHLWVDDTTCDSFTLSEQAQKEVKDDSNHQFILSNWKTNYCCTLTEMELVSVVECVRDSIRLQTITKEEGSALIQKIEAVRKGGK